MIIDGGNAHYTDTRRREAALRERGIHFVGSGISGGEEGALNGPSIMPGGRPRRTRRSARCSRTSRPRSTACRAACTSAPTAPATSSRWCTTASSTPTCSSSPSPTTCSGRRSALSPQSWPRSSREWNKGDLESYLIEITAEVLGHIDADTGKPFVDVVVDQAEQKGTGRWTVQSALDLGVPVTGIAEAVFARALSGHPEQRAAARSLAGPPGARRRRPRRLVEDVRQALYASKIVAYAQGFDQIAAAARSTAGTSTWARWPRSGAAAASSGRGSSTGSGRPTTPTRTCRRCWSTRLRRRRRPTPRSPGGGSWPRRRDRACRRPASPRRSPTTTGCARDRLPAALLQGLRDYFGAHTYRRVDREGSFHTDWSGDRAEQPA